MTPTTTTFTSGGTKHELARKQPESTATRSEYSNLRSRRKQSSTRAHTFLPSVEYLSNSNLMLHKIHPNSLPSPSRQTKIDLINHRREFTRLEQLAQLNDELWDDPKYPVGPPQVSPPSRPSRPHGEDLTTFGPGSRPVFSTGIPSDLVAKINGPWAMATAQIGTKPVRHEVNPRHARVSMAM